MKSLVKALGPSKDGFRGTSLEACCQMATAKTLNAPDPELNAQVVHVVNGPRCSPEVVVNVLKGRLSQKNPHKVYLAIVLIRQLLDECGPALATVRTQILADVAHVASTPMNRYGNDLHSQQQAKHAAYELLHLHNAVHDSGAIGPIHNDGHLSPSARRHAAVPSQPRTKATRWEALQSATEKGIVSATNYAERMQELMIRYSSDGVSADERAHVKEQMAGLAKEVAGFRSAVERLLAQLAASEEESAPALMTKALEAVDMMNNAVTMQEEVVMAAEEGPPRPQVVSTPTPTPVPASLGPIQTASAAAGAPAAPVPPSPLDAILELQQALDQISPATTPAFQAAPPQDPFSGPALPPVTGNPFATTNINRFLASGPSSPVASPGFSAMAASEPSPFGPPTTFSSQPPTWASPSPQAPAPGTHGVHPPPHAPFPGHHTVPTTPQYMQIQTPTGPAPPHKYSPVQGGPHQFIPTALETPSMPVTRATPQSAPTPLNPIYGAGQAFYPRAFAPASGSQARPPPPEDAFAAIVSAEMRGAPKSKGGAAQSSRGRAMSSGSEGDEGTQVWASQAIRMPADATGPMGGDAALRGTAQTPEVVSAGVTGAPAKTPEVVSAGVKGAPVIAADTLPRPGAPLPPLPAAPVAFEESGGGGAVPHAGSGEMPEGTGAPGAPVSSRAEMEGGPQASAGTSDWDTFLADRLGAEQGQPKVGQAGAPHPSATSDPFLELASERRPQST